MRRIFINILLLLPVSVFSQNMIFNPGFDMTPWDTGWVDSVGGTGGFREIKSDTVYYSPPNSCKITTFVGGGNFEAFGKITQTIYPPAINCSCRVLFKYLMGRVYAGGAGVRIEININNEWKVEWSDNTSNYINETIDSTKNWIFWEKYYTINDTLRGINFVSGAGTVSPSQQSGARFWIDDVYVAGELIGIEGNTNIKTQILKLEAFPNPFVGTTIIRLQDSKIARLEDLKIKIYDISGKLVEETDKTVIGRDLEAGVYFVKCGDSELIKITKIR